MSSRFVSDVSPKRKVNIPAAHENNESVLDDGISQPPQQARFRNLDTRRRKTQFAVKHLQQTKVWIADRILGEGMPGSVQLEIRQNSHASMAPDSPSKVRAVKVIRKRTLSKNWNYLRDLEIALRFSTPDYADSFVQSDG
ncbi:hypothetical protein MAJ_08468, partial [Metarhizium majus ARSEF 297]